MIQEPFNQTFHEKKKFDKDSNVKVTVGDSAASDGFGRTRMSLPHMVWDSKSIYGLESHEWEQVTNGAGSSIVSSSQTSSIVLTAGGTAGDHAILQTRKYFPYIPGHSQKITITLNPNDYPAAGFVKRFGYFDAEDGIFFELTSTSIRTVVRSSVSGSPVDSVSERVNWNDTLDGSGDGNNFSEITLDTTKAQIITFDFQWLGVGRVRFGLNIDGHEIDVDKRNHANNEQHVYMRTPNLPIRYEVTNVSAVGGTATLEAICSSVVTEGATNEPSAHDYSDGMSTLVSLASGATADIIAFRQTLTYKGRVNRRVAFMKGIDLISTDANIYYEMVQYQPGDVVATWTPFDADHTSMEMAIGAAISSVTGGNEHTFNKGYMGAGHKDASTGQNELGIRTHHNEMLVNYDGTDCEVILIRAKNIGAATTNIGIVGNFLEVY